MVIAESGSTKTDWRIIEKDHISQWSSRGINPNYAPHSEIRNVLDALKNEFPDIGDQEVFFYGSGCKDGDTNSELYHALKDVFKGEVHIYSDVIASAKAGLGEEDGVAVILGTGANVALYKGGEIHKTYSGYGYLLGDEGSGAYLGKLMLKGYLEETMPQEIRDRVESLYKWTPSFIIDRVYKQEEPNLFMASLAEYIFKNRKNVYFKELIIQNFEEFFRTSILPHPELKNLPMSCTGSIAYFFEAYLKHVAEQHGIYIQKIVQQPIAALVLYHQN